jgi:hypothetical protein
MTRTIVGIVIGIAIAAGALFFLSGRGARAGPNGGDLVPLDDGKIYAELLTNADTGEAMVHTWDKDLRSPSPIKSEPLSVGSGENRADLRPYPTNTDPPGTCSRFYGQADWMRGGHVERGWLHHPGGEDKHHDFNWGRCWKGGRNTSMWTNMGAHRHGGMGGGGMGGM